MLHGSIHPAFARVAAVFRRILPRKGPGGAAVCVYHKGEKVVDVWGGTRNDTGSPWPEDTLSLSFSTTKGVASTLLHIHADRGLIDYDAPVAQYWPEFGEASKEKITVRQLMCHEAGLYALADMVDHGVKAAVRAAAAWSEYTSLDHPNVDPAATGRFEYEQIFVNTCRNLLETTQWDCSVRRNLSHWLGGRGNSPVS